MSLDVKALQHFRYNLEPCALCRSACVSTQWNGILYEWWLKPPYDTLDNRLAIAKIYTGLASERFNRFLKIQIKQTALEIKGRLAFPARIFLTQEIQQPLGTLNQLVSKFTEQLISKVTEHAGLQNILAEENSLPELQILVQCNPTFEKINDFILNNYHAVFAKIAIYAKETSSYEESPPDVLDLTQIKAENERIASQFLHSFFASGAWADSLVHTMLETSSDKRLTKELWMREIKRILPSILSTSGVSLLTQQFTISELEKLTQFYSSPLADAILKKITVSKLFENIKQIFLKAPELEHKIIEMLQTAANLKMSIEQDDMHEIIPGLFLGNCNVAGVEKRFNTIAKKVIKQFLQLHCITHIICLGSHQEPVYPNNFTYKLIPIRDHTSVDISAYFDATFAMIDQVLTSGKGILVHCDAGVSRSASIVIAYIMRKNRCDYESAFNQVRNKRSIIDPNTGFVKQLRTYQEKIRTEAAKDNPQIEILKV